MQKIPYVVVIRITAVVLITLYLLEYHEPSTPFISFTPPTAVAGTN